MKVGSLKELQTARLSRASPLYVDERDFEGLRPGLLKSGCVTATGIVAHTWQYKLNGNVILTCRAGLFCRKPDC